MGGQCCSALADWRGGAASWRAEWARQLVFATTSANNRRRWLIPNGRTIEVAVTFFSEAIRAADLKTNIPQGAAQGNAINCLDVPRYCRRCASELAKWSRQFRARPNHTRR